MKDVQERNPAEVLEERAEEVALAQAVLEERVAEVTHAREDDRAREQDLETVQVEAVELGREAEDEVVDHRADGGGGDTV